ncbi:MAG TPA: ATP-binding protein, partial [Candidatus Ozemobacteraceae bacterium]
RSSAEPDPHEAGSGSAAPGWRSSAEPSLLIARDGREIPVSSSAAPIQDEQGTTIGVVLVFRSQAVERALERERLMLTETIRSSMNEIYIFDATTLRFRFVNQGALNNLGYSTDQIREMTLLEMNPTFSREKFLRFAEPLFNGTKRQIIAETEYVRADGSSYPVEAHLQLIDYRGDRVFLSINQDLTTKRKVEEQARLATAEAENLQQQLFHAQKMESVGRLAGGVAHDFNNMLGVIIGHADLAMAKLDSDAPVIGNLQEIRRAAEHSADLTRQLLAFARKQTIHPRPLDLNDAVSQALKMLRRLIGESIQLLFTPGAGLWTVQMDPAQLDQILANLAVNARDAISGNGTISIRTSNESLDEEFAAAHTAARPGEFVLLAVSDTGCGMDTETRSHLFEPFFTTKHVGEGTGLGLATIYGIISQNEGFILVSSEVGVGSEFRVYLPRSRSGIEPARDRPASNDLRGTETLLLVEDEPELLLLAKTVLSGCGYRVLTAGSPEEALRLVESHTGRIDLLITDVVMPVMNGRELSDRISVMRPDIRVLYISGYTADIIARQGIVPEHVMLLEKPFSPQEFAVKVRAVLDGPEGHHFL